MKLAADSSAFAKCYVKEAGSEKMEELLRIFSELALSVLVVPEITSALNRRLREQTLTYQQYHHIKHRLLESLKDVSVLQITPDVVAKSVVLMEKYPLRAMDALHVASAIIWRADLLVTADKRQFHAANEYGLTCKLLGA